MPNVSSTPLAEAFDLLDNLTAYAVFAQYSFQTQTIRPYQQNPSPDGEPTDKTT